MNRLLFQMAVYEAEQVAMIRKQETGGARIDLEDVFKDERMVKLLVIMPINN